MIVVDASIFIKLFKMEDDNELAQQFIAYLVNSDDPFLAPSLVLYEASSAAIHIEYPFAELTALFDRLRRVGLVTDEPTRAELLLAERIATTEASGGGFPGLFDSIYHAMAIHRRGTFFTADRRHFRKASPFGHMMLLADWLPPDMQVS